MSDLDRDLTIRTIIGEAGGEPPEGQAAVAHVITNRVNSGDFGDNPSAVVTAPGQFESWSTQRPALMAIDRNSPQYQNVGQIVDGVTLGTIPDNTNGAVYFLNPSLTKARGTPLPSWAQVQPSAVIGKHAFFQDTDAAGSMAALGLKPSPKAAAPVASPQASVAIGADDISETMDALGLKPTAPPAKPQTITGTVPVSPGIGLQGQVLEGMPIIGPLMQKGVAATGAAIQPVMGVGADQTFGQRYEKNLQDITSQNQQYAAANPVSSGAANVVGGLMATAPLASSALAGRLFGTVGENIGARVYSALAGGAGIGASDAALRGDNPLTGATIGAATGAGGVLAGEGLGSLVTAAKNAAARPGGPLAGVNATARQWLSNALANETPASLAAAKARMGPQGFAADINPATTNLATGVATSGEAPASSAVTEAYRLRNAGQRDRIDAALTSAMGSPVNVVDTVNRLTAARSTAADPLYEQFRNTPIIPTGELKSLLPRLEAAGAFDQAQKLAAINGDKIDLTNPTAQTWDYAKRALDSKIDQAYGSGDKTTARALVNLKNATIDAIEQTPAGNVYRQARRAFADQSSIIDQLAAGRDTFLGGRSGISADELAEELRGLSQPELMARIQGMRSAAQDALGDAINGDTTLRNKLLAGNNQAKIKLMVGAARGQQLIDTLEQEKYLGNQAKYVLPTSGSPTAGRTEAVNALQAPPLPHWNPNIAQPLSFIPPAWVDALRPSTVLQGGRNASYAAARQQLAPILLTREGSLNPLIAALTQEAGNRASAAKVGRQIGNALTAALIGAGGTTYRLRGKPNVTSAAQ